MREKHVLIASAFLSFMAACNNDALETVNEPTQIETSEEIVGATLLSKGATMIINTDGASESRMTTDGKFEQNDQVGFGWFNAAKSDQGNITTEQAEQWEAVSQNACSDPNIYANHVFKLTDNIWSSYTKFYQGAHFAYFPNAYNYQVGLMTFQLENKQTTNEAKEPCNKGLQISPKMQLTEKDVNKNKELNISVGLYKMYNTLKFNICDGEGFDNEHVQSITVSYTTTTTKSTQKGSFVTKVTLNPHGLPETKYTTGRTLDREANKKNMRQADKLFNLDGTQTNAAFKIAESSYSVTTTLAKEVALSSNPTLYVNLFPGSKVEDLQEVEVILKTDMGERRFCNLEGLVKFLTNNFSGKGISTLSNDFIIPLHLKKKE